MRILLLYAHVVYSYSHHAMASLFHRVLVPAVLLAGAVFTAATVPLVSVPEEPVLLEFKGQPVFQGSVDDLAVPYLSLITALSLGVGMTSATLLGWRMAAQKSVQTEAQLSNLQHRLHEQDALLEALRFSETRLQTSPLSYFLETEEGVSAQADGVSVVRLATEKPVSPVDSDPLLNKVRWAMPGAQIYHGYVRQASPVELSSQPQEPAQAQTVTELLHQIKILMAEVEKQNGLAKHPLGQHRLESQNGATPSTASRAA